MTLQKWALSSPSCAARWSEKQKNGRVKQQHRNMQLKVCYDKNLMHQIDLGDLQLVLIWAKQETIQSIYGLKLNHSCIWETLNSNTKQHDMSSCMNDWITVSETQSDIYVKCSRFGRFGMRSCFGFTKLSMWWKQVTLTSGFTSDTPVFSLPVTRLCSSSCCLT